MEHLVITNQSQSPKQFSKHNCTHQISIIDFHGKKPYLHPSLNPENYLLMIFEDVLDEQDDHAPTMKDVISMYAWIKNLPEDARLLVHCYAGVSRSTAVGLLALMINGRTVDEAIEEIKFIRDCACPNPIITKFSDIILTCNGELHRKAEQLANEYMQDNYGLR